MSGGKVIGRQKIIYFLILTYAFSWFVGAVIYFLEINLNSVVGAVLVALFMWGPAIATLFVQKVICKDSVMVYGFSFGGKFFKWVGIAILTILLVSVLYIGFILLFGNSGLISVVGVFDPKSGIIEQLSSILGEARLEIVEEEVLKVPPILLVLAVLISGVIAGCTINTVFAFGEELGWRGFLQSETQGFGFWKSSVFIGFFWGLWHAPLIMQGHNYPSYPYLGILMMIAFCILASPIFVYLKAKSNAILIPSVLHGMFNGVAGLMVFVVGGHELIVSLVGVLGLLIFGLVSLSIFIFDREFIRNYKAVILS